VLHGHHSDGHTIETNIVTLLLLFTIIARTVL